MRGHGRSVIKRSSDGASIDRCGRNLRGKASARNPSPGPTHPKQNARVNDRSAQRQQPHDHDGEDEAADGRDAVHEIPGRGSVHDGGEVEGAAAERAAHDEKDKIQEAQTSSRQKGGQLLKASFARSRSNRGDVQGRRGVELG